MHVARQLHDSLDYLSFDDERRQLGLLITAFIRKMSFGRDLEAHLNFYVDCRANFANLDAVLDTLVMGATRLAMQTHTIVHGRHTKRTAAFVKACMAFCFITIPSINSLMLRLNLHLLCAQASPHPSSSHHPHPSCRQAQAQPKPKLKPNLDPNPNHHHPHPTHTPSQVRPQAAQPAPAPRSGLAVQPAAAADGRVRQGRRHPRARGPRSGGAGAGGASQGGVGEA